MLEKEFEKMWSLVVSRCSERSIAVFYRRFQCNTGTDVAKEIGVTRQAIQLHCKLVRDAFSSACHEMGVNKVESLQGVSSSLRKALGDDNTVSAALSYLSGARSVKVTPKAKTSSFSAQLLMRYIPGSCSEDELVALFMEKKKCSHAMALRILRSLLHDGVVVRDGNTIVLREASGPTLIVQKITEAGLRGVLFTDLQSLSGQVGMSDANLRSFLSRQNVVKIKDRIIASVFLKHRTDEMRELCQHVAAYLLSHHNQQCKLRKSLSQTEFDYDFARCAIKMHGSEFGIYFYGISEIDVVSLHPFKEKPTIKGLLEPLKGETISLTGLREYLGMPKSRSFSSALYGWSKSGLVRLTPNGYMVM